MKSSETVAAIATLCEAFNRSPSKATFAAYEIGLHGLSDEAIKRAVAVALRRCKFMPSPAEVREIAVTNGGSYESSADRAFACVAQQVRKLGSDHSVCFRDGGINATIRRLGGWRTCCDQPRAQFDVWYRKSFISAYIAILREGASADECRYLSGRMEAQNANWEGAVLPGGKIFHGQDYGAGVHVVDVEYSPALPAPSPQPRRALSDAAASAGLALKFVDANNAGGLEAR